MNNQETVTISRESYDELIQAKKNCDTIIDGGNYFIRLENEIHNSQSHNTYHTEIISKSKDKLIELFEVEKGVRDIKISKLWEKVEKYKKQFGELKEKPSFKKLFLGLYYKG